MVNRADGEPRRFNGSCFVRDDSGQKQCSICSRFKPLSEFSKDKRRLDGVAGRCLRCVTLRKYGLSQEMVEQLLSDQDYRCAICGKPFVGNEYQVDHNHECCPGSFTCGSCVRGLLCRGCNLGIGHLKDSVALLRAAVRYLDATDETMVA